MKRNLTLVFFLVIAAMSFFAFNLRNVPQFKVSAVAAIQDQNQDSDSALMIRKANQAVVVIEIKKTINDVIKNFVLGNGVFVSEDGYILTNYHIIENKNEDDLVIHYLSSSEDHQSRYIGDLNAM